MLENTVFSLVNILYTLFPLVNIVKVYKAEKVDNYQGDQDIDTILKNLEKPSPKKNRKDIKGGNKVKLKLNEKLCI